jgi:hypothetical protein
MYAVDITAEKWHPVLAHVLSTGKEKIILKKIVIANPNTYVFSLTSQQQTHFIQSIQNWIINTLK